MLSLDYVQAKGQSRAFNAKNRRRESAEIVVLRPALIGRTK
jgi:hypothetical protein